METYIAPTPEQIKSVLALNEEYEGPILLLNLLKFKPGTGQQTYQKYGEEGASTFKKLGVEPVFRAAVELPIIGPEEWDAILIARYPSIANWLEMIRDADYQKAGQNRTEALLDSRLYLIREDQVQIAELG